MDISFDPAKRAAALENRGLNFADSGQVFAGRTVTVQDARQDYGEDRYITAGHLRRPLCGAGLETPRQGAPRHLHEARTCLRRNPLVRRLGLPPKTRRS